MTYLKEAFNPVTFEHAKNIVLTPDSQNSNKFEQETEFLIDVIQHQNLITSNSMVLDFGCGMGRVSKELINRLNCDVVGVDISERMRIFASLYITNPKKFQTSDIIETNLFDMCLSILVLQHSENPELEIRKIYDGLKENGILVLVNEKHRLIPVGVDPQGYVIWYDDGVDVFDIVERYFTKLTEVPYKSNNKINITFYKKHV